MPPTFRAACALPLDMHTDTVSDALTGLSQGQSVSVKWEYKKDDK